MEREEEVWGGEWGGEGSGGMVGRGEWRGRRRYEEESKVEREEEVHCKKVSIHCVLLYTILTSWQHIQFSKSVDELVQFIIPDSSCHPPFSVALLPDSAIRASLAASPLSSLRSSTAHLQEKCWPRGGT